MKISLNWLKKWVDIPLKSDVSPETLAAKLTDIGLEVDAVTSFEKAFEGVIVGEVTQAAKHENAETLQVAQVFDGEKTHQVVCGAKNCRKGLKTAFAPLGASLLEEGGTSFVIKKVKLRGVESFGMLCSGKELHLSSENEGILEISPHIPTGTLLKDLFGDTIFDISLTPNLGHAFSHRGIAREIASIFGVPVKEISLENKQQKTEPVRIEKIEEAGCKKYAYLVVEDIEVTESPDWLKKALEAIGLRSINQVVDLTNYLMLDLGLPLHAFDLDKLEGKISIRYAKEGEVFHALDGKEYLLSPEMLVIADEKQVQALAGVMGGSSSEVSEKTTKILIEAAFFDPGVVRKGAKKTGLSTEASKRFERGVDPELPLLALNKAYALLKEMGKCTFVELAESSLASFSPKKIAISLKKVNALLGLNLSLGEVENIFSRLFFKTERKEEGLIVEVPFYRSDLEIEVDLIEEILKLHGLSFIPRRALKYTGSSLPPEEKYELEQILRNALVQEGLLEFITCDLMSPDLAEKTTSKYLKKEELVEVVNPTSREQSVLRGSLFPQLLASLKWNIDHGAQSIGAFEIGKVHLKDTVSKVYREPISLGILLAGLEDPYHFEKKPKNFNFFHLKGIIENLGSALDIKEPFIFKKSSLCVFHPERQASIWLKEREIGMMGEIHPELAKDFDIPLDKKGYFAELSAELFLPFIKKQRKMEALPSFPGSLRDITLTLLKTVSFEEVLNKIKKISSPLLEKVLLLDIYENPRLGEDKKNLTLRFFYRDLYKTVSFEEVEKEHAKFVKVLEELIS